MQGTIDLAFWLTLSFAAFLLLLPTASDTCRLEPARSLERIHRAAALPGHSGSGAGMARGEGDICDRGTKSAARRPLTPRS
jgi:hypothetical protein